MSQALRYDDPVEVWHPTPAELRAWITDQLQRLGLTPEKLAAQADSREFSSPAARNLWVLVGPAI